MMGQAVRIHKTGGPEALRLESIEIPPPAAGEALLRQTAIGLNFIDIYYRSGLYEVPGFPACLGQEGAGVVEAVGESVAGIKIGDRVAYCGVMGAYAHYRVIDADKVVPVRMEFPIRWRRL